jgi:hypothetical protein
MFGYSIKAPESPAHCTSVRMRPNSVSKASPTPLNLEQSLLGLGKAWFLFIQVPDLISTRGVRRLKRYRQGGEAPEPEVVSPD